MSWRTWAWLALSAFATAWLITGTISDYQAGGWSYAAPRLALGIWFFALGYAIARTHSNLKSKDKKK